MLLVAGVVARAAAAAARVCVRGRSPPPTLALGLALRLALGAARGGLDGLWAVFQLGNHEAASEYLPALPAFDFGTRFFLDTFAEIGTSLPVHAVGHPPGLLLLLHWLGHRRAARHGRPDDRRGGAGHPPRPTCSRARCSTSGAPARATLLYVFAPSAVLYGATSADALYATLALGAAIPLAARRPARAAARR